MRNLIKGGRPGTLQPKAETFRLLSRVFHVSKLRGLWPAFEEIKRV